MKSLLIAILTLASANFASGNELSYDRIFAPLKDINTEHASHSFKLVIEPSFKTPVIIELIIKKDGTGIARVFRLTRISESKEIVADVVLERSLSSADTENSELRPDSLGKVLTMKDHIEDSLDGQTWTLEIQAEDRSHKVIVSGGDPLNSTKAELQPFNDLSKSILDFLGVFPTSIPSQFKTQ